MGMGGGGSPELQQYQPGDPRLPEGQRTSRILGPLRAEGARGVAIALVSTVVVLALIVWAITSSPNWPEVKQAFFDPEEFKRTFPDIARAFLRNIKYFLIAEVFILAWALVLAVMRSLQGPVFFPLRALSIVYTDLFRGIPTVLVVYLLGFGIPSLGLPGVPSGAAFWGVVGLILVVLGVRRRGLPSRHRVRPSEPGGRGSVARPLANARPCAS